MALTAAEIYRDFEQAHRLVDESLVLSQTLGDTWGVAFNLQIKGYIAHAEGDLLSALSFTEKALEKARKIGDRGE